jgi:hypothetical protein
MSSDFEDTGEYPRPQARLEITQGCRRQFRQRVRRPPNLGPGANERITAPTQRKEADIPDRGQIWLGRDGFDQ